MVALPLAQAGLQLDLLTLVLSETFWETWDPRPKPLLPMWVSLFLEYWSLNNLIIVIKPEMEDLNILHHRQYMVS